MLSESKDSDKDKEITNITNDVWYEQEDVLCFQHEKDIIQIKQNKPLEFMNGISCYQITNKIYLLYQQQKYQFTLLVNQLIEEKIQKILNQKYIKVIIKQQKELMAFVYRSPRHLSQLPIENNSCFQDISNIEANKQNIIQKLKQPIKGLANKNYKSSPAEKQFYFAKDFQNMKDLQNKKKQNTRNKQFQNENKEQYFFKSKCKRLIALNDTTLEETKLQMGLDQEIDKQLKQTYPKRQNNKKSQKSRPNENILKEILAKKSEKQQKLPCLINKQQQKVSNNINLLHSKKKLNFVFAIPSIPGKQQQFGYVVKKDEIYYPTQVTKPRFNGQKGDSPGPTDYFVQNNKKPKGVLKFSHSKNNSQHKSSADFYALVDDQQALKLHNEKIKKWIQQGEQNKKQNKRKNEKLQKRELSTASNQSGETQYQFDTTPGPGYYDYSNQGTKKNFRSNNQKFKNIFFNKQQRFQNLSKQKSTGLSNSNNYSMLQRYDQQAAKIRKNNKFFISKLIRDTKMQNNSIAPSPGHYDIRISMQNDLIAKILKNSPNLFNNKLPRLNNSVISITPGPGHYSTDKPSFKVESFKNEVEPFQDSNIIKGQPTPKLSYCQKILIQNNKQTNLCKRIHQRQDSIIEPQYNYAPFMSSTPKCVDPNDSIRNDYKKGPSLDMCFHSKSRQQTKIKTNAAPFNSSQEKNKQISNTYIAEAGLYQSNQPQWDKKSFNVLFN